MRRGTTPIITFKLPFSVTTATKISVVFAQCDSVIVEKNITSCSVDDKKIIIHLTEEETLKFSCHEDGVDMQIRLELNNEKMASNIMHTTVDKILKEGIL